MLKNLKLRELGKGVSVMTGGNKRGKGDKRDNEEIRGKKKR